MKTIDKQIERLVADSLPAYSYIFANWYDASMIADRVQLPAVVHILPVSGVLEKEVFGWSDTERVGIAFVGKVPKDATGQEERDVFEAQKTAARTFIAALNASGVFDSVSEINYTVLYDRLTSIVTGVFLEFDLTLSDCE